jgi:hypothetical protein
VCSLRWAGAMMSPITSAAWNVTGLPSMMTCSACSLPPSSSRRGVLRDVAIDEGIGLAGPAQRHVRLSVDGGQRIGGGGGAPDVLLQIDDALVVGMDTLPAAETEKGHCHVEEWQTRQCRPIRLAQAAASGRADRSRQQGR